MLKTRWAAVPIEGLCARVTSGGTPSRSNPAYYEGGTIPWIKTGELRGWYVNDIAERITPTAVRESSAKVFPPETVLLAMYGDGKTMGSVGLIRTPAATNQACCAMLVDPKKCDPKFLMYSLVYFKPAILKLAISGAQRNLNGKSIKQFAIGAPPVEVQQRIASILSAYDDLIENNTRRIEILEEMARRIYEEWFVRFRFPGHEGVQMVESELGLVPEGWQCGPFTDIADVLSGGTPKKAEPEFWGGAIPFFTPTDAPKTAYVLDTVAHITDAGLMRCASHLYAKDTVFITARGTVGKLALASGDMAMNQSCYALKARSGYGQVFLYLATQGVVSELKAKSHGAVFDTIIMDTFRLMQIVKPPVELAAQLDGLVRPLFDLSLTLSRKNANLRATRDLLLQKLISGELDVSAMPGPQALAA